MVISHDVMYIGRKTEFRRNTGGDDGENGSLRNTVVSAREGGVGLRED